MKITLLWLFIPYAALCQQTAFFETKLYFEDAAGNKDSLIVGHDEGANHKFNPQFGEIDITAPWDSVFEVRAGHYLDFNQTGEMVLSKKIIGSTEGGFHPLYHCLWVTESAVLLVYAKHLPVTVSWKIDDFKGSFCRIGSTLTPHILPKVTEFWHEDPEALKLSACMAEVDSFTTQIFDHGQFGFYRIDEVEGIGTDTVFAFLLNFRFQNAIESPCTATIVSTDTQVDYPESSIYPNPTNGILRIAIADGANYKICNPLGQVIYEGNAAQVDLSGWESGLYFLSIQKGHFIETKTIVKMK